MRFFLILILPLLCAVNRISAQACTQLGQTPQSAFPICGTRALKQASVPLCDGRPIPLPSCNDHADYEDVNPYWYKFTCYEGGTLGFTITPNDLQDDYDWQLFDVTGKAPVLVYSDASLQVAGNWSAIAGTTGASTEGTRLMACSGYSEPKWSSMPTLQKDHQYLLMISHFTQTQSGYVLSFGGGTANITDPLAGAFLRAEYHCMDNRVTVKLNKKFQCKTMAADGHEFQIVGSNVRVTSVVGVSCSNGFDMDSVVLYLQQPLPPGSYKVRVLTGRDGNTMLDACDNPILAGKEIDFIVPVPQSVPFDKISAIGCAPDKIMVYLSDPVLCTSVATNGSDFRLSGTNPGISITKATTFCNSKLTDSIELTLNTPIYHQGSYDIDLVLGSDGNTLISECGLQTPLGDRVSFSTADTVNAAFSYRIRLDCVYDTIFLEHDGARGVTDWQWSFEDNTTATGRTYDKVYTIFGQKTVQLQVTNGVCSATHTEPILLDNELKAGFAMSVPVLCPLDMATFTDQSIGNIISHQWDFGFGNGSRSVNPNPFRYPIGSREQVYEVQLIVEDNLHCFDTVMHTIKTVPTCRVAVPTAFTPNNDGTNDFLYPLNGYKTSDLTFRVYARNGQLVFETRNWLNKWDGTINGSPAPVGTYAWVLEYTDTEFGNRVFQKGVSTLLR